MALKLSEKKALNEFIDGKIKSGYGIILDFKVQKHDTLKTEISKENYSAANQYIKKNAHRTWWKQQVGKPQQPTLIRKRK
tara:strand:- start:4 stop:243 length:240 start_codon:yes stop_codon:yes gene_type:complete